MSRAGAGVLGARVVGSSARPPEGRAVVRARRATLRVLPLHLVSVLLVAGCGGSPAPSGQPAPGDATPPVAATPAATPGVTGEMTGIDRLFLSMMAGHTEQTLQIVGLVRDRLTDSELRTLVAAVEATESDELATARGWLAQAGRSARADDHAGHGTGPEQLARLRDAPDTEVDAVLVEVLSAHQQAAADLARAHLAAGTDARVLDLARRVEQSRTAQVALMAGRPG
ncbi:DUF305 domain-containing protein [Micromonospora andamanensis]|uniref:DUF305 domain-containing protein n=1 Tax=Micromonospora andamanensis TaxID=1287068 RepID=UPI001EF25970|nr:DUF305 domain-containing protein [Micromonospora andamanensis]